MVVGKVFYCPVVHLTVTVFLTQRFKPDNDFLVQTDFNSECGTVEDFFGNLNADAVR